MRYTPSALTVGWALASGVAVVALAAGCNAILGIEPVTLVSDAAADAGASRVSEAGGPQDLCTVYCSVVNQNCTGALSQYAFWPNDCLQLCAFWETGNPGDTTGDTRECRIYHAGAAQGSTANATFHCPHAGPLGGGPGFCVAPDAADTAHAICESFCELDVDLCKGIAYEGPAACEQACLDYAYTGGGVTTDTGNSLDCRVYHLEYAAYYYSIGDTDAGATHCSHTAVQSAVCM
ncbi:MAG TPA: hypothetical protein VGM06_02320 [Polyangiaceae bacterium]